jgi:hypothetical protein
MGRPIAPLLIAQASLRARCPRLVDLERKLEWIAIQRSEIRHTAYRRTSIVRGTTELRSGSRIENIAGYSVVGVLEKYTIGWW